MTKWKSSKHKLRLGICEIEEYEKCIDELINHDKVQMMRQFKHHHSITCFEHSVNVSFYSYMICRAFGQDYKSAARGGLLHDLFLYDWRTTKLIGGKHAFLHPEIALSNASALFRLNYIEQDIILKHMFPLTPKPPLYKESFVVCLVDKCCAFTEYLDLKFLRNIAQIVYKITYISK
jgi:uncharacterized protein